MRLAFLCSGLEPGRDGVGDFARTLARHCADLGHEIRLAAVREQAGAGEVSSPTGELRLHDIFQRPDEARKLAEWLQEFQPDWVSVHFTPFGFHPRGLGAQRAARLREWLPASARRHIMLHEIWLQPGRDGSLRHRALGWAQRRSVDAWAGPGWRPALVHTQARLHRARLQARGVTVELLPLCTNFEGRKILRTEARAAMKDWPNPAAQKNSTDTYWIGHFGAFHDQGWDFTAFAKKIASHPDLSGKRISFLALGRAQAASAAFAEAARNVSGANFHVIGELAAEKIPLALQACDAAFTSTPWDIIEKSGTVAAWRALDVPVLVTRAGATDAAKLPPWPDPGLFLADAKSPLAFSPLVERVPGPSFLDPVETARAFLSPLENAPTTHS
jgi:hypothetical protein